MVPTSRKGRTRLGAVSALLSLAIVAGLSLPVAWADPPGRAAPRGATHGEDELTLSQSDAPDPVSSGNDVAYVLTVSRGDDDHAAPTHHGDDVVLTDTLPTGSALVSVEASQGSCIENEGVVTCDLGPLGEGDTATVEIVARVPVVEELTTITNAAEVADEDDRAPGGDDTSRENTAVLPPDQDMTVGFVPETGLVLNSDLGTGATEDNPTTTRMTIPAGRSGVASIAEGEGDPSDCPAPYTCFGQRVDLSAPGAYGAPRLRLVFTLDASSVPPGTELSEVKIFRDGVLVPKCVSSEYADPCVQRMRFIEGGDLRIGICSSDTSGWRGGT